MGFQATGPYLMQNLLESVKDFINTAVILPYQTSVAGTNYSDPVNMLFLQPDDSALITQVPAIILEFPDTLGKPEITGMADNLLWSGKMFWVRVYPALLEDPTTESKKPSLQSASRLQGLFEGLRSIVCFPLNDYSTTPPTSAIDYIWVDDISIVKPYGKVNVDLALEKHRFDVRFDLRYVMQVTSVGSTI